MGERNQSNEAPKTWGVTAAAYFHTLRNKPVQVITTDGKAYRGTLVGVDTYDIIVKQPNGLAVLITKHAVKLITPDTEHSNGR